MKTIDYTVQDAVHAAVQAEFGCTLGAIAGMPYTAEKFVTVFILRYYYGWDARTLAVVYKLPVPYVDTVVARVMKWYGAHPALADLIHGILDAVERISDVKPKAA